MKNIITVLAAFAVLASFTGCADESASVRVANQVGTKANVQFKQANSNTINHNDVTSGTLSNYQDVVEGSILVTAVIQDVSASPSTTFNASKNNNYTVFILAGTPPTLRVDTQGK